MQFQKKEKRQTTVRFDSHHVRLRTGEVQRKTGSYMYRWTDKLGKRNTIYAATLEDLREQEEQILVDQHDGIKANIKNVTVNDVYELWCQLKRGIKDSTMKNYIYMYELFVKPTFGKKKLVQVKKSDVRRFYNQLIDDKVLKPSTVDVIHNIVHQVFQIAVDDDMIRSNPAANMLREIKMAHGSEIEKRKALTLEQEELFLGSISCPEYVQSIYKMMNWNKECRYKIYGRLANSERGLVLVFDLASAVMFDPLPEEYFDKHTGKMKKRIVKYYPDEIRMKLGRSYSDYEALQQRSSFESLSGYMDTSGGAVPATVSEELAASLSMQEQERKRETLFGTIIGNGGDDDVRNNE